MRGLGPGTGNLADTALVVPNYGIILSDETLCYPNHNPHGPTYICQDVWYEINESRID